MISYKTEPHERVKELEGHMPVWSSYTNHSNYVSSFLSAYLFTSSRLRSGWMDAT